MTIIFATLRGSLVKNVSEKAVRTLNLAMLHFMYDVNIFEITNGQDLILMQVRIENEDFQTLLNSKDITDTIAEIDDVNSESKVVFLQRSPENSIAVSFANGVSVTVSQSEVSAGLLSFVAMVPLELHKMSSGLLGNFNEDSSDDFMYPDGTVLDIGSSDAEIHDFGQSCKSTGSGACNTVNFL